MQYFAKYFWKAFKKIILITSMLHSICLKVAENFHPSHDCTEFCDIDPMLDLCKKCYSKITENWSAWILCSRNNNFSIVSLPRNVGIQHVPLFPHYHTYCEATQDQTSLSAALHSLLQTPEAYKSQIKEKVMELSVKPHTNFCVTSCKNHS